MNIVLIHSHDTGKYIQPYGYAVQTPNLMRFAEQGICFRNAFSSAPNCSPSRAALFTGTYPHNNGMLGLAHYGFRLKDYSQHLARFLSRHGYETVLCGIQHEAIGNDVEHLGYELDLTAPGENNHLKDRVNAQRAAQYIKERKHKPFFLSFGMFCTHREFPAPKVNPNYVMPPFPIADHPQNRKDMAGFMASVQQMDECTGMILQAIKQAGIEDKTVIIYTTDHGIAFPNMKCSLFDTGIGVSLLLRYPGMHRSGDISDALVSQLDLFPTLCELLNISPPSWLKGYSLLPILNDETAEIRQEIHAEANFHGAYMPMRCIRTKRFKYIKRFDHHGRHIVLGGDGGMSENFMLQHGVYDEMLNQEMLFDLYLDPVERVNIMKQSQYEDVYQDMVSRLDQWMRDTEDPLIQGAIQVSDHIRVNLSKNPNVPN